MHKIIIDEEFKLLLPTLDKATYESLEANIQAYGVRDPLVVWNDILIDGYNRYSICTKHDLPFNVVSMEFSSRDEVLQWIVDNQISRRNLTSVELSHFRGLYYNAAKRIKGTYNQYMRKSVNHQSDGSQNSSLTAKDVGERFNVSSATIERDAKVAEALKAIAEISPEAKQKILSGEVPVDRNKLQRLSKAPREEIEDVVEQIIAGTYNRNDYRIRKTIENIKSQANNPNISNIQNDSNEQSHFNTHINQINNIINTTIKLLTPDSNISELKIYLRVLIDSLEEMHENILDE